MKTVKEVSVKLENRPGTLSEVSELLGANGINIIGLTVQTEGESGVMCFVSTDPARTVHVLESSGYAPTVKEIIAAEAPHHPGGLNALLKPLKLAGVNIEHLYACIGVHGHGDSAIILFGVNDAGAAYNALSKEWIRLYGEELYNY